MTLSHCHAVNTELPQDNYTCAALNFEHAATLVMAVSEAAPGSGWEAQEYHRARHYIWTNADLRSRVRRTQEGYLRRKCAYLGNIYAFVAPCTIRVLLLFNHMGKHMFLYCPRLPVPTRERKACREPKIKFCVYLPPLSHLLSLYY